MSEAEAPAAPAPAEAAVADQELEVSVVIPCLNEARTIGGCVEAAWHGIRQAGVEGEVIVADNGSSDGSQEIATRLGARVVPVPRRGYGSALQTGFLAARGRLLVMGDADLSYDFREIPKFVAEQRRTGADMVVGNRLGSIEPGAMPWSHRWIGNPLISWTIRRLFRVPLGDCYCGLRLVTRDAHRRLKLNAPSMEYALQMIVQGSMVGLKYAEVPITLHVDGRDHAPHLKTVRDGYRSFRFLFQHAPVTAYVVPGVVAAVIGLVLLVREALMDGGAVPTGKLIAAGSALLMFGWMLAVLGVVARVFVTGFLGEQADESLKRFFRVARLESAVLVSAAVLVVGILLAILLRGSAALFQLGLDLAVIAVGSFVAAFVVSLIGRAIPESQFETGSAAAPGAAGAHSMAEADPATRQNEAHSLATQEAMSKADLYNRWLVDSVRQAWEGSHRVLDVGCSIGNVTQVVADRLNDGGAGRAEVVGLEIIPAAAARFEERFRGRQDLRVLCGDITSPMPELDALGRFDSAVSFNVIEHIDDDVGALRAIGSRLKPGGRVGLLVPGGGDRLYGTLDSLDRHYRRYTPGRLRQRLEAAGYEVVSIQRVNMLGALLWYTKGRIIRSREIKGGEVSTFDHFVPVLRRLDALFGPPFGQSLAAVGRLRED